MEGFNIRVGYRMAVVNKPRRGLHHTWVYPRSKDVLNECGMHNIAHYIGVRRDTILAYVVNRPIYQKCREGVREQGSAPRQWWWEQPIQRSGGAVGSPAENDADGAHGLRAPRSELKRGIMTQTYPMV